MVKFPWQDKTGLAKTATVLAMVLMISFGLCGANVFAVLHFLPFDGSEAELAQHRVMNNVLTFTGFSELAGIIVSFLGLVVCGIMAIFRSGGPPPTITKGDD